MMINPNGIFKNFEKGILIMLLNLVIEDTIRLMSNWRRGAKTIDKTKDMIPIEMFSIQ